ncbi:TPA: thioesterase [Serratia liquefaciens]|nr:thioesterase [Serratia liquefaciens]
MHNIPFRGAERCLKALTPTRHGKLRLICFPHAGGSAGTFRAWSSLLRSDIELFAMQYPGREDRADEAPACQHRGLVAELQQALAPLQDKPCVFFGHSLGGRLALATALSARLPPIGLIVSACSTPYAAKHGHLLRLTRSALIETLHESGQTAAITDENADLLDAYLPLIRADLLLASQLIFPRETHLPIPLAVFYGEDDLWVDRQDLADWRLLAGGEVHERRFPGRHLFLNEQRNAVIEALHTLLAGPLSAPPTPR